MFPQAPCVPQFIPGEVATHIGGSTVDYFVPTVYDDNVLIGDMIYDYLARERDGTFCQYSPYSSGPSSLSGNIYGVAGFIPPAFSPSDYTAFSTTNDSALPLSPTSSLSEVSSSPEQSPAPDPSCQEAFPVRTQRKWCCSACNKDFRGKWEAKRHIENAGKRAKCSACGKNLSARSLKRHFEEYCKGDIGNLTREEPLVED